MRVNINPDVNATFRNTSKLIDNSKSQLHFRNTGEWSVFEEVIGFPYQFNENADFRKYMTGTTSELGRVFYETIVRDINLAFIEPGQPKFMPQKWFESDKRKDARQEVLKELASGGDGEGLTGIFKSGGFKYDSRYYAFEPKFTDYMKVVNSMATYVAVRLGLTKDSDLGGGIMNTPVKLMRLSKGGNTFSKTMIPFYFDGANTKYNEGGGSSTGESKIFGSLKSAGSLMREADFLFNGKASDSAILNKSRDYIAENLSKVTSKIPGVGDTLTNLIGAGNMSLKGAQLMFPEMWEDSNFKKSITISFKFTAIYGNKLCIFNEVLFPTLCLLALALPRQVGSQGYASPFLIKVFSKGWFNCDLGMIESIDIDKGPGTAWSEDGLPLEINVNITVKDLYSTLMMTAGSGGFLMNNNTGLSEYLETMAAMNVVDPNIFSPIDRGVQDMLWNAANKYTSVIAGLETSKLGQFGSVLGEMLSQGFDFIEDKFFKDNSDEGNAEGQANNPNNENNENVEGN